MRLRNIVLSAVAACVTSSVAMADMEFKKRTDIGMEYNSYDVALGEHIQTTSVHPDDRSFLSGNTTTDLKDGSGLTFKAGIEASIEKEYINIFAGISGRINVTSDEYREGIYDTQKQSSDARSEGNSSQVFTQVVPDTFSFVPYIGVGITPSETISLNAHYGLPFNGFTAESGHDRYGKWETIQSESWSGLGTSYGISAVAKTDNDIAFGISFSKETYEPDFSGEDAKIDINSIGASIIYEF